MNNVYIDTYRAAVTQPRSYCNPVVRRVIGPHLCKVDGCFGRLTTRGYNGNIEYMECVECRTQTIYDANRPWNFEGKKGLI